MALAGHHVNSASSLSHRHAALQLLRQNLQTFSDFETMYSILDTIVILFSLDVGEAFLCLEPANCLLANKKNDKTGEVDPCAKSFDSSFE